ncbi:MAG: hypothetical protein IAE95_13800, partial [Chitinophagaceae bacterium]|nr:hypothetical protein [Chitinophagaceae bacterium]
MSIRFFVPLLAVSGVLCLSACGDKKGETKLTTGKVSEHYNKGNDLVLMDKLEEAEKEYLACIKEDSNDWRAFYQLGGLYQLRGDFRAAMYSFNRSVEINPEFTLGFFNKANLEEMVGDEKASKRDLDRVLTLKRDFFMAYMARARKASGGGNFKEAVSYFDSAIKLRPDFYLAYSMRGSCKYCAVRPRHRPG